MVRIGMDLTGIDEAVVGLWDAIDDEVEKCFTRTAENIADVAKRTHPFQNRTGVLEASLHGEAASGKLSADTLQAAAVASADYASYVEAMNDFAYLEPASEDYEPYFEQDADDAFERAFRRAGWR